MAIKFIAIGNTIMGDDGIGIKVANELSTYFEKEHIECIFAETDVNYALSQIENGDFLFIIDATFFDINPGTITYTPLGKVIGLQSEVFSQHQSSLIYLLKTYGKAVEGYLIGIEIAKIDFNLELSDTLKNKFFSICEDVYLFINHVIKDDEQFALRKETYERNLGEIIE